MSGREHALCWYLFVISLYFSHYTSAHITIQCMSLTRARACVNAAPAAFSTGDYISAGYLWLLFDTHWFSSCVKC